MTKDSSSGNFKKDLEIETKRYADLYGHSGEMGYGFQFYLAHLFVQVAGFRSLLGGLEANDTEVDLSPYVLRGDDLGVDLVLEDEMNQHILLVQAKWTGAKSSINQQEMESFFDKHHRYMDKKYVSTGGDHVRELLDDYAEKINSGWTATYRFVSNKAIKDETRSKCQQALEIKQNEYNKKRPKVSLELFAQRELKEFSREVKNIDAVHLEEITFNLQSGSALEFKDPVHGLVSRINGNELVDMYKRKDVGPRLFEKNIRLHLGGGSSINKLIEATAMNEPEKFFFYNNGVSAICSEFNYDEKNNRVTAKRFQIINGAQTVGSLKVAMEQESKQDLFVLFRLTASEDTYGGEFTNKLIESNNTQNSIKSADFRSNDPIQKFLKEELTKLSGHGPAPKFKYVPKRSGERSGRGGFTLEPERLARVRHAFIYGPSVSFHQPRRFFNTTDDGLYHEAFGVGGEIVDTWDDETLREAVVALTIEQRIIDLAKQLKKEDPESNEIETKYLKRLARYVMALVAQGLYEKKGKDFHSWALLLADTPTFEQHVDPLISFARPIVRAKYIEMRKESVQPDRALGSSLEIWEELKDAFLFQVRL